MFAGALGTTLISLIIVSSPYLLEAIRLLGNPQMMCYSGHLKYITTQIKQNSLLQRVLLDAENRLLNLGWGRKRESNVR